MELQPCSPALWATLLGPHLLLQQCAASPRDVFQVCAAVFDIRPSLHLTAIFSWAQPQVPRSGVLLMLCSPGPPGHTQQATVGALPGCSQVNNYTTESVPSQTKPLPCLGPDWFPNPHAATSRTWSWSHSAQLGTGTTLFHLMAHDCYWCSLYSLITKVSNISIRCLITEILA